MNSYEKKKREPWEVLFDCSNHLFGFLILSIELKKVTENICAIS